jgi:lipopolysaccharide transport system permease protein
MWNLLLYKAWADLCSEARRYYISYLWWVLEPVLEMLIFYLVFAVLLQRGGPNFVQFLLVGLVIWKWFQTTVIHCGNSIVNSRGLIRQAAIPKVFFPSVIILTDTFKAMIAFAMVLVFLALTGFTPNPAYAALPLLFLAQLSLIMAVGLAFAALTPFFPDFVLIISHLLRLTFYLSGIFFDPHKIPEPYRAWFFLNPMARLIEDYRGIVLHQRWPDPVPLLIIGTASVLVTIWVWRFIRRHNTVYPRIVAQ